MSFSNDVYDDLFYYLTIFFILLTLDTEKGDSNVIQYIRVLLWKEFLFREEFGDALNHFSKGIFLSHINPPCIPPAGALVWCTEEVKNL